MSFKFLKKYLMVVLQENFAKNFGTFYAIYAEFFKQKIL